MGVRWSDGGSLTRQRLKVDASLQTIDLVYRRKNDFELLQRLKLPFSRDNTL